MDSLILFDATQPSNFDLALCIILLRSQPASLSTTEYIHLLRSLTIVRPQTGQEHDHDNSHDCRTGTNQHRRLDASRRWNILLDNAEGTIMELRLKVMEMEKERDAIQARLKSLEKSTNHDAKASYPGKKRKGNKALTAVDAPREATSKRWSGVLRNAPESLNSLGEVEDLALWTQVAPKLLVSLRLLRYATEPRLVSTTIQQICGILSSLTHGSCEGSMSRCRDQNGDSRSSRAVVSSRLGQSRIAPALTSLLRNSTAMIISALDKVYISELPSCNTLNPGDSHVSLALYAFIRFLGDISSSIHTNSISILNYVLRQSQPGVAQSTEEEVKGQSTPAGPEPHLPIPDLRGGLTEFLIWALDSLKLDVKHHQDITEALAFKSTTIIVSLVIAVDPNIVSKPEPAKQSTKKKKRKLEPTMPVHHQPPPDLETQRQLTELATEETSWFLLDILHCSLAKYSEILASRVSLCGGSDGGPVAEGDNILKVQDSQHGQCLVDRAKSKLRDAFLQGVSDPLPWMKTESPEKSTPLMGTNMRLMNLPVIYEVWKMIGFES